MASVLVLLEPFNRKGAAALGIFPCATAPFLLSIHIKNFDAVCKQYALLLIQILVEYTVYYGMFS